MDQLGTLYRQPSISLQAGTFEIWIPGGREIFQFFTFVQTGSGFCAAGNGTSWG